MAEKKAESGAIRTCYLPIRACFFDRAVEDAFVSTIKIKIDFNFVLFSLIRIFAAE